MAWTGSISLDDNTILHDVTLNPFTATALSAPAQTAALPERSRLRFLSVVETASIPFYLGLGAPWRVTTSSAETEGWLARFFASSSLGLGRNDVDVAPWWQSARTDSDLGVLLGVESGVVGVGTGEPRVTELLLYASRSETGNARLPTPPASSLRVDDDDAAGGLGKESKRSVHALLLSSDLLHAAELTPPPSPTRQSEEIEARFLPQTFTLARECEPINEPPVRKRRSAADAFDEASERRQKARRRGGEGVIAAAAPKTESQLPSLKHRRSVSSTQPVPLQTRPLSRSPSVPSSRPTTAAGKARSSLSQVQSRDEPTANVTETKNKDFISRIVMAGMRLHGLSQSKSRHSSSGSKSKADSAAPSPAIHTSFSEADAEKKNDEDFKLIYHQTYKGTCCAFRAHVGVQTLQPFAEQVRETVDRLLGMFCLDPLAEGLGSGKVEDEELTPGGRKAFGSGSKKGIHGGQGEVRGPFAVATNRNEEARGGLLSERKREGG